MPEDFLCQCVFGRTTSVRPYVVCLSVLVFYCLCSRGRRACLPGCLLVCVGRTHRCAPTLFVFLFFCLISFCRRGRRACLPGCLLVCFCAHTSVRPYIYRFFCCRGRPVCLSGCLLVCIFGRTHRCAPTFVFLFLCLIAFCRRGRPMCLPGCLLVLFKPRRVRSAERTLRGLNNSCILYYTMPCAIIALATLSRFRSSHPARRKLRLRFVRLLLRKLPKCRQFLYCWLYNTLCHHCFGYFESLSLFASRPAQTTSALRATVAAKAPEV